jgi:hypothetical protein
MSKATQAFYERDDVLVVLTTATTGLGHTRVTAALLAGLPKIANKEVIGLSNSKLKVLHRITSINPELRALVEFVQNSPLIEKKFTTLYRWQLQKNTKHIRKQLRELASSFRPLPKHVLIVCSHFSLAHQLGEIMPGLRQDLKSQVSLSVVVTDDSPQGIWLVREADYIFVPSRTTEKKLSEYADSIQGKKPKFVVNPYPVSQELAEEMTSQEWKLRLKQLTPDSKEPLRVMIPISGAAVQLSYFQKLIQSLEKLLPVKFLVVSRKSKHTQKFLDWCVQRASVEVTTYEHDWDVVSAYERIYKREVVGVEITKPSEQAFKSLYTPRMYGGSVLLFSNPVGRQEDDNVAFMRRFGLLPNAREAMILYDNLKLFQDSLKKEACGWRGVMLPPDDGELAAQKIATWHKKGILLTMTKYQHPIDSGVVRTDGVDGIWKFLAKEHQAFT